MNAPAKKETLPSLAISEQELMSVLRNSLYPGAQDDSIKMVISYCKASGLDPMQKPVHIVPMWDSKSGSMRDVVMPGVGLYRTQAARSGCAGVTEPEFGPDITESIGGQEITFPAWCRVTVKRLLATGQIVDFTAKEIWKENYAVKGGKEKSVAPNAMWTKRPYGQLAKCAEAQALRKAFPEIGAQPTADEMEGKSFDDVATVIDNETSEIIPKKSTLPEYTEQQMQANMVAWKSAIDAGKANANGIITKVSTRFVLSDDQKMRIAALETTTEQEAQP